MFNILLKKAKIIIIILKNEYSCFLLIVFLFEYAVNIVIYKVKIYNFSNY